MQEERISRDTRKSGYKEWFKRYRDEKEFKDFIKNLVKDQLKSYVIMKRQESWIMRYLGGGKE